MSPGSGLLSGRLRTGSLNPVCNMGTPASLSGSLGGRNEASRPPSLGKAAGHGHGAEGRRTHTAVGGQWRAGGPPGTPASPLSGRYPNFMDVGAAVGDTAGLRSHGVGPGTSGLPRVYYGSEV